MVGLTLKARENREQGSTLSPSLVAGNLVLALCYAATGKMGLLIAVAGGNVTLIWPPTGIAAAAFLLWGYRMWPGVALGAFALNFLNDASLGFCIATAIGNPLPAVFTLFIVRRYASFQVSLERLSDVFWFVAVAVLVSTTLSATIGTLALAADGTVPWNELKMVWTTWWIGDAMGVLIVGSVLLTAEKWVREVGWRPRSVELSALLSLTAVVSYLTFHSFFDHEINNTFASALFSFVIWAAVRFGPKGTTLVVLIVSVVAVLGTMQGTGPFVHDPAHPNLLILLSYLLVMSIIGLMLGSALAERNRAEEQQRIYEIIVSHTPDLLSIVDRNYTYRVVNPAYHRAFFEAKGVIIGKTIADILGQEHFEKFSKPNLDRAFAGESFSRQVWVDLSSAGQRFLDVQYKPLPSADGKISNVLVACHDLTKTKKIEDFLADAQRIAHLGSWEWDIKENRLWGSDETYRIIGYGREEFGNTVEAIREIIPEEDHKTFQQALDKALMGEPLYNEHRIIRRDGVIRHVLAQAETIFDNDGRPCCLRGTVQDISDAKDAQAHLNQVSKLAALGEMATGAAHEINQPLNIIRMAAEMSLQRIEDGGMNIENCKKKLNRILEQVDRASAIINYMRMFGRKSGEEATMVWPGEVVQSAVKFLHEQFRLQEIEIVLDIPDTVRPVLGDPIQLEQVVMNLLTNARDAIRDHADKIPESSGPARITVTIEDDPETNLIRLIVGDSGGGIPENVLPQIFDPFFTTKEVGKGTGVGLSVSYGIVTEMGGAITAKNVNGGARFTVSLPTTEEEPSPH